MSRARKVLLIVGVAVLVAVGIALTFGWTGGKLEAGEGPVTTTVHQ